MVLRDLFNPLTFGETNEVLEIPTVWDVFPDIFNITSVNPDKKLATKQKRASGETYADESEWSDHPFSTDVSGWSDHPDTSVEKGKNPSCVCVCVCMCVCVYIYIYIQPHICLI
jgi:hypothetical protein